MVIATFCQCNKLQICIRNKDQQCSGEIVRSDRQLSVKNSVTN